MYRIESNRTLKIYASSDNLFRYTPLVLKYTYGETISRQQNGKKVQNS